MSPEEDVLKALKALAEMDAEKEAPPEVEARLRSAFRQKKHRRVWPWMLAAAAAIVVMIAAVYFRAPRVEPVQVVVEAPKPALVIETPPQPVKVAAPVVRRAKPREVATEFFPLVDFAPPLDRAELVRVNLPA